jgi:hypothetical protein
VMVTALAVHVVDSMHHACSRLGACKSR